MYSTLRSPLGYFNKHFNVVLYKVGFNLDVIIRYVPRHQKIFDVHKRCSHEHVKIDLFI